MFLIVYNFKRFVKRTLVRFEIFFKQTIFDSGTLKLATKVTSVCYAFMEILVANKLSIKKYLLELISKNAAIINAIIYRWRFLYLLDVLEKI